MVVVPAFAGGEDGQNPIVAGIVGGGVAPPAEQVGERIDGERAVPEHHGGHHETPHQPVDSAQQQKGQPEGERGQQHIAIPIKPAQFGVFVQIGHELGIRLAPGIGEKPAHVRIPKPAQLGRMHVLVGVRIFVVPAVVAGPPKHASLSGALGADGQQKLKDPRRAVGAMGKIAVIARRHDNHADVVNANRQGEAAPRPSAEKHTGQGRQVHHREKKGGRPNVASPGPW